MKQDRRKSHIPWAAVGISALPIILIRIWRAGRLMRGEYARLASLTPVPTLSPPPLAFRPRETLLRVGSIGPEVMDLQTRLKELGYYNGSVDGQFYDGTRAAVIAFQQRHGLAADGMAGSLTLQLLFSDQAQRWAESPQPMVPDRSPSPDQQAPEGVYTTPSPGSIGTWGLQSSIRDVDDRHACWKQQ